MRRYAVILCGALAACTSGNVSVPNEAVFYEVPQASVRQPAVAAPPAVPGGGMQTSGGDDFSRRIETALAGDPGIAPAATGAMAGAVAGTAAAPQVAVPPGAESTPLDDDRLNLNLYTLEQQRIDAAIAERELEAARRQLIIVQPGAVPQTRTDVNIALYAQQTRHAVGQRQFSRGVFATGRGNCRRFASPDEAQRVFLASGGPERDPYNLDPDGDGFACDWDPEPFRRLRL